MYTDQYVNKSYSPQCHHLTILSNLVPLSPWETQRCPVREWLCVYLCVYVCKYRNKEALCRFSRFHQSEAEIRPRRFIHLALVRSLWNRHEYLIVHASVSVRVCVKTRTVTVCVSTVTQRHQRVVERNTRADTVRIFVNEGTRRVRSGGSVPRVHEGLYHHRSVPRLLISSSPLLRSRRISPLQSKQTPPSFCVCVCVSFCADLSLESNEGGESRHRGA